MWKVVLLLSLLVRGESGGDVGGESENSNENEIANPEPKQERLIDGPFGIKIKGDKPLSQLLQEIE